MNYDTDELVAFTRARAAGVAGLTERQVDYWMRTGLVRPAIDTRLTARPIRLYDFQDLMSLLVIAELKARGISVRHVRRIVEHLRADGYSRPLTELRFAVLKGKLYIQHLDGAWEGGGNVGQLIVPHVLDLQPLRARLSDARRRPADTLGHSEQRRGTMGYKPLIAGTRVPVATVRRYLDRGCSTEELLEAFPALEVDDIKAVKYAAV
jgi:uncharacterized protein (DUF433 family)